MGNAFNPYEAPRADDADPFVARVGGDLIQASRGTRFANFIVDSICRMIMGAIIGFVAGVTDEQLLGLALSFGSMIGYYLFFEGVFQATPGKMVTRTRVVDLDGNKPTFMQIFGRTLARF